MTAEERRTALRNEPPGHGDPATYAFGDVELAALRLQLMDRVFAAPSRALLDVVGSDRLQLAVDLGCGPGFSTRLLGERLRPVRLAGMDTSERFLERARTTGPRAGWFTHDVTSVPFPTEPADLLHARFVLTHLPEPESVLVAWFGQLNTGGYLLTQDDEEVTTGHSVLVAYEEMARSLVDHRGGDLWVGSRLAGLDPPPGVEKILSRVYRHRVPAALAAQLFAMNFAVWRHDPYIVRTYPDSILDEMAAALTRLAGTDHPGDVVFDIRQLGYRRR